MGNTRRHGRRLNATVRFTNGDAMVCVACDLCGEPTLVPASAGKRQAAGESTLICGRCLGDETYPVIEGPHAKR